MGRPKKETPEPKEVKKTEEKEEPGKKSLELALAQIEKTFGKGSIMTLRGHQDNNPAMHVSSGSLALDIILGKGGFVFGRPVELYGVPGGGKSTLCLQVIANAQKLGLKCAFIDREQGLDPDYAVKLGVDVDDLFIAQPDSGDDACGIIKELVKSGQIDVIVLDSLATCTPKANDEKRFDENTKMAGRAALLTRFFDETLEPIARNKVLLLCTNQIRANLSSYGNPESTGGGYSSKHSVSQRIEIRPGAANERITDSSGQVIGTMVKVKTVKNRMNSPYKEATFDVIFGEGIDKVKDIFSIAVDVGVVEKAGTWYIYGEHKMQGLAQVKEKCKEISGLLEEVKAKTIAIVGPDWGPEGKF